MRLQSLTRIRKRTFNS